MDRFIHFLIANLASVFYILLGVGLLAYSCFAKRMTFEGDVAVSLEKRKAYIPIPEMRKYGVFVSLFPLVYGAFTLVKAWLTSP